MAERLDIITLAYRVLGLASRSQPVSADRAEYAGLILDGLYAELVDRSPIDWDLETIPDAVILPLADLLSVELAAGTPAQPKTTRHAAYTRLMAITRRMPDVVETDELAAQTLSERFY